MSLTRGLKIEADPNNWTISNGKLFVFAGPGGPEKLLKDPADADPRRKVVALESRRLRKRR